MFCELCDSNFFKMNSNGDDKKKEIKLKIVKRLTDWSTNTTSHGIPQIVQAKKFYLKVIWALFLLVSIALCSTMVVKSIKEFFEFDVTTKIREISHEHLTFPTVTICNINPFVTEEAYSFLDNILTGQKNITSYFDKGFENEIDLNQVNQKDVNLLLYLTNHPKFNQTIKRSFNYWPEQLNIFYFAGIGQDKNRLKWYYHPLYGNCYRFNSGYDLNGNKVDVLTTGQGEHGFGVEMFIGPTGEYFKGIYGGFSNGVAIFIDDQDDYLLFAEQAIFVKPNTYADIKVSRINTKTMPSPYSDCIDNDSIDTGLSRELKKLNLKYSRSNCFTLCMQKLFIQKYNCNSLSYPPLYDAPICLQNRMFSYNVSDCFDECPFECKTTTFETSISTSEYFLMTRFKSRLQNNGAFYQRVFNTSNITFSMLKSSFVRIFVYFDRIVTTEMTEAPMVTPVDLIANIGGTLGLFIGISVLSFVEIIELLVDLLFIFFKYIK